MLLEMKIKKLENLKFVVDFSLKRQIKVFPLTKAYIKCWGKWIEEFLCEMIHRKRGKGEYNQEEKWNSSDIESTLIRSIKFG